MSTLRKHGSSYFLLLLALVTGIVWYAVFTFDARNDLRLTVFDIGQGDSIFY